MILVAYRHGLQASEACDLQWHQIELPEGALHVRRVKNGIDANNGLIDVVTTSLRRFVRHAIRTRRRSTFSLRRFSHHCAGRSLPLRRNTVFRQSISGRNTPRPGGKGASEQYCRQLRWPIWEGSYGMV
jgi:integrase